MAGARNGTSIYCQCHGTERLLDIRPTVGIEAMDGRHGTKHRVLVDVKEALERLSGTLEGSAIVGYVRQVLHLE